MNERTRTTVLAILGGLIAGLVFILLVVVFTSGDDDATAATTSTTSLTTTTVAATTITTATTSSSTTSTTTTSTTTTPPLGWGTSTMENTTLSGSPGPHLTDVRVGDHSTFTRVVFDFDGDGTPLWVVGYSSGGPDFSGTGEGAPVTVDGSAFLTVNVFPGRTTDTDTFAPTYAGPVQFDPGIGPIADIAFIDDFESDMMWVIGLDVERGFTVSTLTGPVRFVIDIEN